MAVNKNQVTIAELTKQFRETNEDFLSVIKDQSSKVNNDVIKLNEIGADPDVLIDNVVYPIAANQRTDNGIPVSLHRLDTVNTIITHAEAYALPYDKNSSVIQQHKDALRAMVVKLGLYSLAPTTNSAKQPVFSTTGTLVGGRRQLTIADLIAYKKLCDNLEIPVESRNLVLCSDHVNDLLLLDNSFRDRYNTIESGKIIKKLYGFNMWENLKTPTYDNTNTLKAFNAVAAGTDRNASVFFSNLNAFKAEGSVDMYMTNASDQPRTRQTEVGFSMYYIVAPVTTKGIGAIVAGV
jgi:hypothetical protein